MPPWIPVFAAIPLLLGAVFLTIGTVLYKPGSGKWPLVQGIAVPSGTFGPPRYEWRSPDGVFRRGRAVARSLPLLPGTAVTVAFDPKDFSRFRLDGVVSSGQVFIIIGWIILILGLFTAILLTVLAVSFPA